MLEIDSQAHAGRRMLARAFRRCPLPLALVQADHTPHHARDDKCDAEEKNRKGYEEGVKALGNQVLTFER